jgi:hypothetical protein
VYKNGVVTKKQIADSMRYRTSGAFNQRLADLKNYGLIEGKHDKYKITSLGLQIFETHDFKLLEQTIKCVPFWRYLFDKYHKNLKKEDFLKELISNAKLNEKTAIDRLDELFNDYIDDITYATSGSIDESPLIKLVPSPTQPEVQPKLEERSIKTDTKTEKHSTEGKQPKTEQQKIKRSIDYGDRHIDINDGLDFAYAELMMKAIKKDLIDEGVYFEI